jgi:hypothetical protein
MAGSLARRLAMTMVWCGCALAWLAVLPGVRAEAAERERWQELATERATVKGIVVSRPDSTKGSPPVFFLTQVPSLQKGQDVVINARRVSRAQLKTLETQGTRVSLTGSFIPLDKWEQKPVLWADFINPTADDIWLYNKACKAHDAALDFWRENYSADGGSLGKVNMAFSRIIRTYGVADRATEKAVAAAGDRSTGTIQERSQRGFDAFIQSVKSENDTSFGEAIEILVADPTLKRAVQAGIQAADTVMRFSVRNSPTEDQRKTSGPSH